MRKIIVSLMFAFALLAVTPYTTQAVISNGDEDGSSRIEYLLEMLEKLQSQLTELLEQRSVSGVAPPKVIDPADLTYYCPSIDRVLQRGVSGSDVRELQEFLRSTGDYTYSESTGYYGPLTESAVKNFQKRASVVSGSDAISTGYGVFGPLTNKAIYRYCKPVAPDPDPLACTMEYAPVCGKTVSGEKKTYSNKCHLKVAGASYLYSGECGESDDEPSVPKSCKVWYDGCNTCSRTESGGKMACTMMACFAHNDPYCKEYFEDEKEPWEVPPTCEEWYDGCNVCSYDETGATICDTRECSQDETAAPYCKHYSDDDTTFACTDQYEPVCGHLSWCPENPLMMAPCYLKEKTFSNLCYLKQSEYDYAHDGECGTGITDQTH